MALTAGEAAEPSRTDYRWHGEERRERGIFKWRDNSYVNSVQSEKKFNLLYKKTFKMVSCRFSVHLVLFIPRYIRYVKVKIGRIPHPGDVTLRIPLNTHYCVGNGIFKVT